MLKEGTYFAGLSEYGDSFCSLKVWKDGSHNLRIITCANGVGNCIMTELHSQEEVRNLYKFLKEHFENDQKFTHEEYLKYVEDMKAEDCPWEEIASEEQWRAELEAEFCADDK